MKRFGKLLIASVVVLAAAGAGYYAWLKLKPPGLPAGIVSTNGRVEATQVDISTKIPGRVIEIVPHEGDMVSPGEVVARVDTSETLAQFHQAQASAELARQTLVTRQAEVASDEAQLNFANEELRRTATLVSKGWSTHELLDQRNQQLKSADAALKAAMSQVDEARATVKTADARVEELQAVINDSTIKSPVQGRLQYRLVEPGAVLPPGGKIATVIDLNDVYTTVYLPSAQAGRLKVGNDPDAARLVIDAYPDYIFPASVSFVAPEIAVHPQDRRGPVRTRAALLSGQAAKAARRAQGHGRADQVGAAGGRICEARSRRRMAGGARSQAAVRGRAGWQVGCGTMSALVETERPQKVVPVAASLNGVTHRYGKTVALDSVTLEIPGGCMAGLIGPDGVGKSTLLGLIAGVRKIQTGEVRALDGDLKDTAFRQGAYARIAYMPQGLGRNLYPTLSVFENLDFIGRLFGQGEAERKARIDDLTRSTGLDPFLDRPAGKLSGGMKQKLSLCCSLIHDPDLLILDEPTTGVDPLSRRQFWELIDRIRGQRPQMSVVVATAYMEEADQYAWLAAMDGGRVIATGSPAEIKKRAGVQDLEAAFIALLPEEKRKGHKAVEIPPRKQEAGPPAIEADGLTKRFDKFVAVDHVSFRIEKGEIFGFLGSNGCGKSTTMKMLTGLLPATEGKAMLFGQPVGGEDMEMRRRVGYMSQAFSLYGELTVRKNLELHAKLFDLPVAERGKRVDEMLDRFGLRRLRTSSRKACRSASVSACNWRSPSNIAPRC